MNLFSILIFRKFAPDKLRLGNRSKLHCTRTCIIFAIRCFTKHQVPRTITYNNLSDMEQKEGEKSELLKLVQEHSVPWDDSVYDYIADQELENIYYSKI